MNYIDHNQITANHFSNHTSKNHFLLCVQCINRVQKNKNTNQGNITVPILMHFIYPEHCQERLNSF